MSSLACLDPGSPVQGPPGSLFFGGSEGAGWWAELERADLPAHHGQLAHLLFAGSSFLSTLSGPSVSQVSWGTGMLSWLVAWLGLPGGRLPFRLVLCRSSAPWIPGLLPVALHLPTLTDIHACIDQRLHSVIQHFRCSGPEWLVPWL